MEIISRTLDRENYVVESNSILDPFAFAIADGEQFYLVKQSNNIVIHFFKLGTRKRIQSIVYLYKTKKIS